MYKNTFFYPLKEYCLHNELVLEKLCIKMGMHQYAANPLRWCCMSVQREKEPALNYTEIE